MKQFGLIGFPLGYSFSATYFAKKFETENIVDCNYKDFPIENASEFEQLKNTSNICGYNVTIPHKETIIPYLDELDAEAKEIGAVNTILFKNGKTKGFNTDIYGFENSLKPLLKPHHKEALIVGTGGASKAVQFVFEKLGIKYLFVSRNATQENQIQYDDFNERCMQECTIIVNTTPLGTFPKTEECPNIPYHWITEKHILFDLVYNPEETLFMKKGKAQGAIVKNGYEMLELQAERSWEIWNNQ